MILPERSKAPKFWRIENEYDPFKITHPWVAEALLDPNDFGTRCRCFFATELEAHEWAAAPIWVDTSRYGKHLHKKTFTANAARFKKTRVSAGVSLDGIGNQSSESGEN